MPSVIRQSAHFAHMSILAAMTMAMSLQGCANSELARFAPPGIIKYEDIAGDKPQNPEVAARIVDRRAEPSAGDFPVLSQTPGPKQRPKKRPAADIKAEKAELITAREQLEAAVADQRARSDSEREIDLTEEANTLKARIEEDTAISERDRRERLAAPANDGPDLADQN